MKRLGFEVGHAQRIKTVDDNEFRFGHIVLLQERWFRKRLIPVDAESGKQIIQMEHFNDEDKQYHEIDVNKIMLHNASPFSKSLDYSITLV